MDLLRELAASRSGKGLSQAAIAQRLAVPRLAITRLEAGIGSVDLLLRVMEALEFRISGVARGATLPMQLHARRLRLGISSRDAGRAAGIDLRTVQAIERGKGTVASLVALLNVVAPKCKKSRSTQSVVGI